MCENDLSVKMTLPLLCFWRAILLAQGHLLGFILPSPHPTKIIVLNGIYDKCGTLESGKCSISNTRVQKGSRRESELVFNEPICSLFHIIHNYFCILREKTTGSTAYKTASKNLYYTLEKMYEMI